MEKWNSNSDWRSLCFVNQEIEVTERQSLKEISKNGKEKNIAC